MPNRKYLAGGTLNPNYRVRSGSRSGDAARIADGTENPTYRRRSGHASRDHKLRADGVENPTYRARTGRISKFQRGQFIGWDGEGVGTDVRTESVLNNGAPRSVTVESQAYVLLANSIGNHIYDANGISTIDAFEFLLSEAQAHPNAIHVLYGGTYDCEMILKDLSAWQLRNLNDGEFVRFGDYKIQYRPQHSLFICRDRPEHLPRHSVTIFDVIGFFQSSFVDAIEKWCPNHADHDLIVEGKAGRGQFKSENKQFLIDYNAAELRAFLDLMSRFHAAVKDTDYVLSRWDGAGALAAAMMRKHDVHRHMARRIACTNGIEHEVETVPSVVRDASLRAMAGGRIECLKIGNHQEPLWHGDINSAYPASLGEVPSLEGGAWIVHHSEPSELQRYALYHVTWDLADGQPLYPFFFRDPNGRISFPPNGEGWYWGPEVITACDHNRTGIAIHDWIEFIPVRHDRPFAFVSDEADRRLRYRHDGNAAEKPIKLGINSLYGKTAQQKGGRFTADGRLLLPRYYQPEWAGYVTACCRAEVYDAAMHDPEAVITIATDGIYATRPLPVTSGDGLGEWKTDNPAWMISVQSGVYFVDQDGEPHACYRGFDASSITPTRVLSGWRAGNRILECTTLRFVTLGAALKSRNPESTWRTWRHGPRNLRLDGHGTKRTQLSLRQLPAASKRLVATRPIPNPFTDECSHPTGVAWS